MPSRLILRLLVVFTRQLEILVTTLGSLPNWAYQGSQAENKGVIASCFLAEPAKKS